MEGPPNSPTPDYSAQPTPDYGTLGPSSDIKTGPMFDRAPPMPAQVPGAPRPLPPASRIVAVLALVSGAMVAGAGFFVSQIVRSTHRAESDLQTTSRSRASVNSGPGVQRYDAASQQEAERLLQRAAHNDDAATSQLESRAPAWRGRIQLTPQLTNFITAGLNASNLRTRSATIRVDLAAMNVAEDSTAVDRLATQAESPDHATRIWALWTLGLLANRGVETERTVALLAAHLSDTDDESRHWAAEALSYTGNDTAIPPLLKAMRNDWSQMVRERAACGLAQSGMFTAAQRRSVIPTLLMFADDPSLDAATRAFTFHALRDITSKNLPDDSGAWRRWYEANR